MKDKLSAFERRLEMLFLLNKCRETTALELSYYFAVSKDTIFRDIDFLNRYAPIYTKREMFGGIFLNDESRKNLLLYLSDDEELCPPSKNRHKKALKNGMNLNNSFVFAKTSAFIPRFT